MIWCKHSWAGVGFEQWERRLGWAFEDNWAPFTKVVVCCRKCGKRGLKRVSGTVDLARAMYPEMGS